MPSSVVKCVPFLSLLAVMSSAEAIQSPLTVRVDSRGGAPCIAVNGKPVRARMFFGAPGSSVVRVGPVGRAFSFEFRSLADAEHSGTIHFRFGQVPGDLFLTDVRIADAETGEEVMPSSEFAGGDSEFHRDWAVWPPKPQNMVGDVSVEPGAGPSGSAALHVHLSTPPDGRWPDFHVYRKPTLNLRKGRRYRVTFWMRAEPAREVVTALYRPGDPFVFLGGPPGPYDSEIRLAAGAGIDFVSFPIATPWPSPGEKADWTSVDAACEEVLRANPRALLVPRFGLDPPEWWMKAHADEMMRWEDGSTGRTAVPASPIYRRDACERAGALVAHIEQKFGDRVAGYHPCGQNTGEWFYENTWEGLLNGYAPADAIGWRLWLRGKYGTDSRLRAAWHSVSSSIDTIEVPRAARRRASPFGVLRNPLREQDLIDFADYQQQAMADLVCSLAHAVRWASGGRKLVLFFYGYVFEFGPVRLGPTTCGHYALRRVLDCQDIDVLCSPISYFDRGIGGGAPAMTAAESVALAGKMWLFEDDTRTHLGTGSFPGADAGAKSPWETYQMLQRNVAEEATRNFATWWMDLAATGWFDDPKMWDVMRRFADVDRPFIERPTLFRPEVAAVIDERSMLAAAGDGRLVTEPGVYRVRGPLGRMGAPYGQFLLDDVEREMVKARIYVFLNAWRLDASQRAAILAKTDGAARVWCYAPGMFDAELQSPAAMRQLSGFRLVEAKAGRAWAEPTPTGRRLGLTAAFGVADDIVPLFCAADATPGETLAKYPDGSAAVALRKVGRSWSLFVGPPGLTSELMRLLARRCGVHLYTDVDCNVYANGPIVVLHAPQTGPVVVDLGSGGPVFDALTGLRVGEGPSLRLSMKRGETRVLRLAAGVAKRRPRTP